MKNRILIVLFGMIIQIGFAQPFEEGVNAFQNKDYVKAIEQWKKVLEEERDNFKACFNIGNAYVELKNYPEAIFYFRKATKINPQFKAARENLKIAMSLAKIDDFDLPGLNFQKSLLKIIQSLSVTIFVLLYFSFCILGIWIWKLSRQFKNPLLGKISFFTGLLMIIFAAFQQYFIQSDKEFIVMQESALYLSPDVHSEQKLSCKAGEELMQVDKLNDWLKVQTTNYESGWIPLEHLRNLNSN